MSLMPGCPVAGSISYHLSRPRYQRAVLTWLVLLTLSLKPERKIVEQEDAGVRSHEHKLIEREDNLVDGTISRLQWSLGRLNHIGSPKMVALA